MLSSPSSSNLIGVLVTNLLSEQSNLQPELAAHHAELNKTSSLLNAVRAQTHTLSVLQLPAAPELFICSHQDLRALVLLLSVQPPQAVDPALSPALQELLTRCRLCIQQRSTLELEVKDHKSKGTATAAAAECTLTHTNVL